MLGAENLLLVFIIYTIIFIVGLKLINNVKVQNTYLDPGLLLAVFTYFSVAPILLARSFNITIMPLYWGIADPKNLLRVVELNSFFLISFSLIYYFVGKAVKQKSNIFPISKIHISNLWIILWILFFIITYFCKILNINTYVLTYVSNFEGTARIIAVGVIMCKFNTVTKARVGGVLLLLLMLFVIGPTINFEDGFSYTANKGGALALSLGSFAYAERVKWGGRLVTGKLMFLAIPSSMLLLGLANFLEDILAGGSSGLFGLVIYIALAFEPRQLENIHIVTNWVDTGKEQLLYGASYINSVIEAIYPLYPHTTLSDWFVEKILGQSYVGKVGYAFSSIAEGYLNFGYHGIFLASLFCCSIALIIRAFYMSSKLWLLGPFLYANTIRVSYYLYRSESEAIIKRIEFATINLLFLFLLYIIIRDVIYSNIKNNLN